MNFARFLHCRFEFHPVRVLLVVEHVRDFQGRRNNLHAVILQTNRLFSEEKQRSKFECVYYKIVPPSLQTNTINYESCSVNRPKRCSRSKTPTTLTGSLLHSRIASVFVLLRGRRNHRVSVQTSRSVLEQRHYDGVNRRNKSETRLGCV